MISEAAPLLGPTAAHRYRPPRSVSTVKPPNGKQILQGGGEASVPATAVKAEGPLLAAAFVFEKLNTITSEALEEFHELENSQRAQGGSAASVSRPSNQNSPRAICPFVCARIRDAPLCQPSICLVGDDTNRTQARSRPEVSSVSFEQTDFPVTGLLHALKAEMGSSDTYISFPDLHGRGIFQRIP